MNYDTYRIKYLKECLEDNTCGGSIVVTMHVHENKLRLVPETCLNF